MTFMSNLTIDLLSISQIARKILGQRLIISESGSWPQEQTIMHISNINIGISFAGLSSYHSQMGFHLFDSSLNHNGKGWQRMTIYLVSLKLTSALNRNEKRISRRPLLLCPTSWSQPIKYLLYKITSRENSRQYTNTLKKWWK